MVREKCSTHDSDPRFGQALPTRSTNRTWVIGTLDPADLALRFLLYLSAASNLACLGSTLKNGAIEKWLVSSEELGSTALLMVGATRAKIRDRNRKCAGRSTRDASLTNLAVS